MRRLLSSLVPLGASALVLTGCGSNEAVENAVAKSSPGRYESLSCTKDHEIRISGQKAEVYRCQAHLKSGESEEVCVAYRDGRVLAGGELEGVALPDLFCEGQA